ncbi:phage virion morphogenesis protein [bacterium]|jgi:phage virion morphogenesis protein|nr:phage virion morphogenesis protein [bacterium]
MSNEPIEIKFENKEVLDKILEVAKQCEDLRPLMKNIAGIFASSTEDNFAEEGRPDKWVDLSEVTKNLRKEINKYPGPILQVTGQLATSVNTYYDNDSAVIGSNLAYAAIHQLGGDAGRNKKVKIPARPYINLVEDDYDEILHEISEHLSKSGIKNL